MPIKLLGVTRYSVKGVVKQKIHYKDEGSNHAIEISGDDKRMTAGEIRETIASKEKIKVEEVMMRKSLEINLNKKAKKAKKGDK